MRTTRGLGQDKMMGGDDNRSGVVVCIQSRVVDIMGNRKKKGRVSDEVKPININKQSFQIRQPRRRPQVTKQTQEYRGVRKMYLRVFFIDVTLVSK